MTLKTLRPQESEVKVRRRVLMTSFMTISVPPSFNLHLFYEIFMNDIGVVFLRPFYLLFSFSNNGGTKLLKNKGVCTQNKYLTYPYTVKNIQDTNQMYNIK